MNNGSCPGTPYGSDAFDQVVDLSIQVEGALTEARAWYERLVKYQFVLEHVNVLSACVISTVYKLACERIGGGHIAMMWLTNEVDALEGAIPFELMVDEPRNASNTLMKLLRTYSAKSDEI